MHTIQLQTMPFKKVCMNGLATFATVIAAAALGVEFSPAATTSFVKSREPIRLPVYDIDQFFKRSLCRMRQREICRGNHFVKRRNRCPLFNK